MKRIAVIGLGEFGARVAIGLTQKGFDVIAIDQSDEIVSDIKDLVSHAVCMDATDEKAMRTLSVDTVDIAVVAIGSNVQSSLLSVALLENVGVQHIYVRTIGKLQADILKSMGIAKSHIINIEAAMGDQLSNTLATGRARKYIQISERHSLLEIPVPSIFIGRSLIELNIRSAYRINIVGIKKQVPEVDDNGKITFRADMSDVPDPNSRLEETDILLILGTDEAVQYFIKKGDLNG